MFFWYKITTMLWDKHNNKKKKVINTVIFLVVALTTRHTGRHRTTWDNMGDMGQHNTGTEGKTTGGERVSSPVVADEESCG